MLITLFCGTLAICLTGCNSTKKEDNTDKETKTYTLEEINLDCDLNNITYINSYVLINNGQLNIYSDKKYSDTNSNCKPVDNNNYHYLGNIYWYNPTNPTAFTTNGNDIYYFNYSDELIKATPINSTGQAILNDYKNNNFYKYDNGYFVTDEIVNYINGEKEYTIESIIRN